MPLTKSDHFQPKPPAEAQFDAGLLWSKHQLQRVLALGLDLLFPPRCAGCDRVDTYWCSTCQNEIDQIEFPAPILLDAESPLRMLAATSPHEGKIRQAIHALKFENSPQLAQPLGRRLDRRLAELDWTIDIVVPVPLHTERRRNRGYNQAQLLAAQVARARGLPLLDQAIERPRATQTQVGLNALQRQENMKDAFRADSRLVGNRSILLIDDVYTTGATLAACARAARQAGALEVYGLTVTRA